MIELRDEYAQKTQNAMPGNEYWSERFDAKYQALAAALAAASALEAPAAGAPQGEYPHEQMDAMALDRYKVVPSNASMLWSHAVVAGDGTQQLYVGREVECQNMARKFAGAFLDGAFAFHSTAAAPTAQAAPALEAPAGPATSAQAQALHRARRALHAIGKTYDDSELRTRALEADEEIDRMLAAAPPAPAARVDDLAALVKKLVQALRKAAPNHVLPAQALDYLKRQGLQGSPLRAAEAAPQAPAAPGMAVTALAGEIIAALEADEKDGGYDLTSGLFGPKFSALVRRWAASEWAHVTAPQAPAAPVLVGDEQADAYLTDPGRLESLARSHPAGLVRALARAALAAAPQAPAVPVAVTTRAELEKLQGGAGSMATIFPADASGFPVRLYAEPAAPAVD
ncbi:hypothetical protein N5D66_31010, partial [Delftia tsuruhatensis]|nr:hypothetical protein [Delftia tsuruhatensis]